MKEVGNPSRLRGKDVTYISDKQFDASSGMYICFSGSWLATDKKKMRGIQFQILSHMLYATIGVEEKCEICG